MLARHNVGMDPYTSGFDPTDAAPRIEITDLKQEFQAWADRVQAGERVIVTEDDQPIFDLVPHRSFLRRLYDDGQIVRATQSLNDVDWPLHQDAEISTAVTDALQELREERLPWFARR
jgi:antitoxin (DNA-binding transcriptional repressor) of toxin-antitoxin stability system